MKPSPDTGGESLALLQRWFQTLITDPNGLDTLPPDAAGTLVQRLTRSNSLSARQRLDVYAQAYHARLVECLAEVFPLVRRMTGTDGFNDLAADYLQHHPSRSCTLGNLSRRFPIHLQDSRPQRMPSDPPDWADFIIDLARFEQAIFEVFDGPGTEGQPDFAFDQLATLPADSLEALVFLPNPSLQVLEFQFPINRFFTESRFLPETETPDWPDPEPSSIALTRRDFIVRRHDLHPVEAQLLRQLAAGTSLGTALQSLPAEPTGPDPLDLLPAWFQRWGRESFFIGLHDPDLPPPASCIG